MCSPWQNREISHLRLPPCIQSFELPISRYFSAVARLFYLGLVCAALPVLRKKQPGAAAFQLPGGPVYAVVGVAICMVLFAGVDMRQSLILAATFSIAFLNWLLARRATPIPSLTR